MGGGRGRGCRGCERLKVIRCGESGVLLDSGNQHGLHDALLGESEVPRHSKM